jgi:dimeric dUTPase (all-alpha-NTP-PPase superfamily)
VEAKQNITFALFDIRPINPETKRVSFDWINSLKSIVDLTDSSEKNKIISQEISDFSVIPVKSSFNPKDALRQELESSLSEDIDFNKEVESFGGRLVSSSRRLRPRLSPTLILKKDESERNNFKKFREEFSKAFSDYSVPDKKTIDEMKLIPPPPYLPWGSEVSLSEKNKNLQVLNLSPAARELEANLINFKTLADEVISAPSVSKIIIDSETAVKEKISKSLLLFVSSLTATFILTFLLVKTSVLKNDILERSNHAYISLSSVQESLSEFRFSEAASSFVLAAKNFELLNDDFKKASAVFGVLDKITLGGVSDTSDLVEAGRLISQAGLDISGALGKISEINLISIIQKETQTDILEVLRQFRLNMIQGSRNLNQAVSLIANADSSLIPESEKEKLDEFKEKLPEFSGFIDKAINYSDALMTMLGQSSPQRYILLFQNTSELRPTGGFPGSYAFIEFDKGVMKEFFVDDIYNPDGQMKEKIIPPRPLQKITPGWGMRDANWFVDFQASARKVAEFYYKDTKILVDGVAAINVDLVPEILKITGPVEMAEFGIILGSDNFITEVQREVEYERTKGEDKPKQVLVEFAPKFLEKLSNLNQEDWMKVFNILVSGIENKDIMVYFADSRLQNFALSNGFAGEIKDLSNSDYLMVNHTNIMGSKTDAVIDNSISLNIDDADGEDGLIHTLELKRTHKGGSLDFYNKRNNDYVRVLLPDDAELIEVGGNDEFKLGPLLDYSQNGFISDPDLERYESKIQKVNNIEILSEGGKKIVALWMIVEPGQEKTVKVKYKTLFQKRIYVQKQPGLKSGFELIFNGKTLFDENLFSDKNIVLE